VSLLVAKNKTAALRRASDNLKGGRSPRRTALSLRRPTHEEVDPKEPSGWVRLERLVEGYRKTDSEANLAGFRARQQGQ
jgi:hypothetical protein